MAFSIVGRDPSGEDTRNRHRLRVPGDRCRMPVRRERGRGLEPVGRLGPGLRRPDHEHGRRGGRRLEHGNVIITGASSNVGGCLTEFERTMVVGEASDEHRHYFAHMREIRSLAIDAVGPGIPVAEVDQMDHDYCKEQGLLEYTQLHTGHDVGMGVHEREFLDRGRDEVMEPGSVYTVEPTPFIPEVTDYRHSDTVFVTEEITDYPKEIEGDSIDY